MKRHDFILAWCICIFFFISFLVLSLTKHNHFLSGYDLGIADQVVWKYSQLLPPVTTINAYFNTNILEDHIEIIYLLFSPLYWVWSDARLLIFLQVFFVSLSGIAVYYLMKRKQIVEPVALVLLVNYFIFYGVQQAIWSDVHSLVFGFSFLAWFIYFLEIEKQKYAVLFFVLSILCKEDIALFTFSISVVHYLIHRKQFTLWFAVISVSYLLFVFFIYFPHFTSGYRYQNNNGLLSNLTIINLFDSKEKRDVIGYSILSYGGLSLFQPLLLLPALVDVGHYFVLGNSSVKGTHGLFGHYRVTLSLFLIWPAMYAIARYKWLNHGRTALYLLFVCLAGQYLLHSPLSYVTKSWFWDEPEAINNINYVLNYLPVSASVVTQNNIVPHISNRKEVMIFWPEKRSFTVNSPCNKEMCTWLKWNGNPEFAIVDTSSEWDIRHFLANREEFIEGVDVAIKSGLFQKVETRGNTTLFRINQKTDSMSY